MPPLGTSSTPIMMYAMPTLTLKLTLQCVYFPHYHITADQLFEYIYMCWSCVIVWVRVVFRKTVVGDWRFDYLSSSHLQTPLQSRRQMMVFMPLVVVLIGQFCRDARYCVKAAVIGRLLCYCCFQSVYCLLLSAGFVRGHLRVACKVQVVVHQLSNASRYW